MRYRIVYCDQTEQTCTIFLNNVSIFKMFVDCPCGIIMRFSRRLCTCNFAQFSSPLFLILVVDSPIYIALPLTLPVVQSCDQFRSFHNLFLAFIEVLDWIWIYWVFQNSSNTPWNFILSKKCSIIRDGGIKYINETKWFGSNIIISTRKLSPRINNHC